MLPVGHAVLQDCKSRQLSHCGSLDGCGSVVSALLLDVCCITGGPIVILLDEACARDVAAAGMFSGRTCGERRFSDGELIFDEESLWDCSARFQLGF